jgi:SET domain-containing protein
MRTGQACIDYLNSTVWATLAKSPIHNVGVFAIRDIPKGTPITDYADHTKNNINNVLTPEELNRLIPEVRNLILDRTMFTKGKLEFYSPNCDAHLQSWMNHSDTPNTTGKETLRHIKKGEELTENFRTLVKDAHPVSLAHFKFLKKRRVTRKKRL